MFWHAMSKTCQSTTINNKMCAGMTHVSLKFLINLVEDDNLDKEEC
jgi:hypothetical protein